MKGTALLPDVLGQIPGGEGINSVTAGGHAVDLTQSLRAVPRRFSRSAEMDVCGNPSRAAIWRNETLRATERLGRALWKKWSGCHARSRIEAQMNRIKLSGDRIVSQNPDRRVAEIHIAVMNRCPTVGTAEIERVK